MNSLMHFWHGQSVGVTYLLAFIWNDPWQRSSLRLLFVAITCGNVSLWLWKSLENSGEFLSSILWPPCLSRWHQPFCSEERCSSPCSHWLLLCGDWRRYLRLCLKICVIASCSSADLTRICGSRRKSRSHRHLPTLHLRPGTTHLCTRCAVKL